MKTLRQAAIGAVAGGVFLAFHVRSPAVLALSISGVTLLLAVGAPVGWLRILHAALARFSRSVASVTTVIVLSILYFGVFWPLGVVTRSKARYQARWIKQAPTYWTQRTRPFSSSERQF